MDNTNNTTTTHRTQEDLKILNHKPLNMFLRYLLPSFGGMLISCIYGLADTFFIGQYEGDAGIAALNIVMPAYMLLYAMGSFFGVGGSILYSYEKGRGQGKEKKYFTISFFGLLAVSLFLMAVLNIWFKPIMEFIGAKPASDSAADLLTAVERMKLIESYGRYVTFGAPVVAINAFLIIFLRNDGAPNLSMAAVVASGFLNIILDYLLVFVADMGMEGAALATISCMGVSILISAWHFFRKRCGLGFEFKGALKALPAVLKRGFPSFFNDFAFAITMTVFNVMLQKHVGAYAIPVYGVLCNVVMVFACLFLAIASGAQPLLATNFSAGNKDRVRTFLRLSLISTAVLCVVSYIAVIIRPSALVYMFISDPPAEVLAMTPAAMRIYGTALFFMGFNFVISGYYQSTLRTALAFAITAMRGLILVLAFMFLIPLIFPDYLYGLWWVVPLADAFTLGFVGIYTLFVRRAKRRAA